MNALERLASAGTNSVGQYTFIDADTVRDAEGNSYRLEGYDAPEIAGFKGGQWKGGTAGAADATRAITGIAESQNFSNMVKTGRKDAHGREVIRLQDENGRDLTTELLKSGALQAGKYTTQDDLDAIAVADLFRDQTAGDTEFGEVAETVSDAIKAESSRELWFKDQAVDEALYNPNFHSSALQFRRNDRTLSNKSLNPFSDSWEQGWTGVGEALFGVASLLGDQTGIEGLESFGEAGKERQQAKLREYGSTITSYKEVKGFGSAIQYVANNAALSVPYMAITAASAVAAPFTYGTSLAIPAAVYTGQTWNEMEGDNKNAALAIGSGVLQATFDKLGITAVFKRGLGTDELFKRGVNALTSKGMTKAAAEEAISKASRRELASFAGDAGKIAKEQLKAKALFKDLAKRAVVGGGSEAATEALQEATAYASAHSQSGFDYNELMDRMIQGAVAGGALGGTISGAGKAIDAAAWTDIAYRLDPAEAKFASQSGKFAEEEKIAHGYVPTIQELAAKAAVNAADRTGATLDERAQSDKDRRQTQSTKDSLVESALNVSSLWRGATRSIFNPELQQRSRSARILADMFGGNLQRIFSGSSFESAKHHKVAVYKNMVAIPEQVFSAFNNGNSVTNAQKADISTRIYESLQSAVTKDGKFDPALVPEGPQKQTIIAFGHQLNQLSNKMHADQKKHNPDLGYIDNYLFKYKSVSKKSVEKDPIKFMSLLQSEYGYSAQEAKSLTDALRDNPEVNNIEDAFSVTKGGIVPGSHRKRSLNMSENKAMQDFMEQDIFANISTAAKASARYTAHREFIGKNGEVISQLLDEMAAEGVAPDTVNKVARQMKDYLDAESGNYKRPTSDAGKAAIRLQKNFMMLTTVASLPLSTISSFVEAALVTKGLDADQIGGGLRNLGREFGKTLMDGATTIADTVPKTKTINTKESTGQERIRDLGFYEWDVGAATVTGVSEVNSAQQQFYQWFFKWNGLSGWTNFTRAARASIAGDYMFDKARTIYDHENTGNPKTREIQEAEESLRNLGIDVETFVALVNKTTPLNQNEEAIMETMTREATFNFVNDAVALPQAANRPLIYQDPRFALFTQFQGFIATFTANHIPKLWGEYVKRGTPAMKYNAFGTMATMIMIGFASQHLKDLIKYGDDEEKETGANPYLGTAEYLQRGVRASGLLGTGERVLDYAFPLYESRSDSAGAWVFNSVADESPALSYLERFGKAGGKFLEGDVQEGTRYLAKNAPAIGPVNRISTGIGERVKGWNFKGGSNE